MLTGTIVPGVVTNWNFDEGPDWHDDPYQSVSTANVTHDSVGQFDASLTNMTPADWVSGQQFTALAFDGINDFLSINGNLGTTLGGTFSLLFWIKTTQAGNADATQSPAITGNDVISLGGIDDSGRLGVSINNAWVARTALPVNDDQWHLVGLTRNATSGAVNVYLDGQLSATATGPTGTLTTGITSIGRRESASGTARYFSGRLDQVAMFNQALNESAVAQWGNNYAPKTWTTTSEGVSGQTFSTPSVFYQAFDAEGDSLRVVKFTQPAHGTVANNPDGTFLYTPDAGYVGTDDFEVTIEDGHGGFSRATMVLNVLPAPAGSTGPFTANFDNFSPISAGGGEIDYDASWRVPRVMDWDGDGKNELLVSADNAIWLYHNSGTATSPVFDAGVKVKAGGSDIVGAGASTSIALVDLTGDGVNDLVVNDANNKLRLFANTKANGEIPVYAAPVFLKTDGGADLVVDNPRIDFGDWNGDGLPDLIVGNYDTSMKVFLNQGTRSAAKFSSTGTIIDSEAYNVYPRWVDLSRNGVGDLLRGINWGNVQFWLDPAQHGSNLNSSTSGFLSILAPDGTVPRFQDLTDGPVVDFGDFNGDGVLDLVMGGQLAGDKVFIAYGQARTFSDNLADLETIFNAHPTDLGTALEANNELLLRQVQDTLRALIIQLQVASPLDREAMYTEFAAHISKYSFLRLQELDLTKYHNVPGLVAQDILIAGQLLTDTPANRLLVANLFGMTGLHRQIYLEFRYIVGDNVQASTNQLESLLTFLRTHPRESYPDNIITVDNFWGDGVSLYIDAFGSAKNTFSNDTGVVSDEWATDIRHAILAVKPGDQTAGDLFTFVVGHEATHSLDAYLRSRANTDLVRRWGQYLVLAGGPDIIAGSDGWPDMAATQQHFRNAGFWDGQAATWTDAWNRYWTTGPGAAIASVNNLRGNIQFLLENPQESLATQGNQHWVDSEGRIIGAIARYENGITSDLTEALTFLDYMSVGMNRVPMFDIDPNPANGSADWSISYADLERDDLGRITRVTMSNGRVYKFDVDASGIYSLPTTPPEDPSLSIEATDATKSEGNSGTRAFTFSVTRTGDTTVATSVHFAVTGSGTVAANAADFGGAFPNGNITFLAGQTQATVTINVTGDQTFEGDEGFQVTLSNPLSGTVLNVPTAAGLILNDDQDASTVSITATDAGRSEGNSGTKAFTFTVTRTGDATSATGVHFAVTANGTVAADATDFGGVFPAGNISFIAGQTAVTLSINVTGDQVFEGDEGFMVTLSNPSSGTVLGASTATGVILNDDPNSSSLSIEATDATKSEGNSGTTPFTFTVRRTGDTSSTASVHFAVTGNGSSAANATDFGGTLPEGDITFNAGQTQATVTINVTGDQTFENDEGFKVTLSNPSSGSVLSVANAPGLILNDDQNFAILSIAATNANRPEGNSGTTPFTFTVTRSGNTASAASAHFAVTGNGSSAADMTDFGGAFPEGNISFVAGQTSATITVNVTSERTFESDEGFMVTLSNPSSGSMLNVATAPGVILNDDQNLSTLSIAATDASKSEGNSGTTPFTFNITRTGDTAAASVHFAVTGNGTFAADATDFGGTLPEGNVTFIAGQTQATITVNVTGDATFESDEGFKVTLSNPSSGSVLSVASAPGVILNDDQDLPTLSITATDATKSEGNSGTTPFKFTVTRTGDTTSGTSVHFAVTGNGSFPADATDFGGTFPEGNITFIAGQTQTTITVNVTGDQTFESDEGFKVTLSNPSSGSELSVATAAAVILNDDVTPSVLSITATDTNKTEGNSGTTPFTFTVTRTGNTTSAGSVHFAVSGNGSLAADPADFGGTFPEGGLSFNAGQSEVTLTVNVAGDRTFEGDEGFKVTLSHPSSGSSLSVPTAAGVILNDDQAESFLSMTATDATKSEGNSGKTPFTFTITRTGDTNSTASVHFAVAGNGSLAANETDFGGTFPEGDITFIAGQAEATLTVNVAGDGTFEGDEGFKVTLSNPSTGTDLSVPVAAGVILNDDQAVSILAIAATDATKSEGNSGTTPFTFTVTRTGDTTLATSAHFAISGNGALAADATDFGGTFPEGDITFSAGHTELTLTVDVTGDGTFEDDKGFKVTLSNPSSGTVLNVPTATGVILNDDQSVSTLSVVVADATKFEGTSGTTPFTFTVTRTGNTTTATSVHFAVTGNGSLAADPTDFGGAFPQGDITFSAGQTTATLTVNVTGDSTFEGNEGFQVTLSNPSSGTVLSAQTAAGVILNDDQAVSVMSIAASNATQSEGNTGTTPFTFTVARTGDTSVPASIHFVLTGNGASSADATDFGGTFPQGEIAFIAGQTEATLTVNVAADGIFEDNEAFKVTLQSQSPGSVLGVASATGMILNDDDAVSISLSPAATTYQLTKKHVPLVIDSAARLNVGVANPNVNGAKLTVSIFSNRDKHDILRVVTDKSADVYMNGKKLLSGKTVIGTVSGGKGKAADLTIQFQSPATVALVQRTLQQLTFSAKSPGTGARTVQVRLTNVSGFNSNTATRQIAVD